MDRLASCYFCGVAVEAPLEEYPVVPRDLRPSVEDQSTVVLCPDCRRKLSTIVERVVAASSDPAQTELGESGSASGDEPRAGETEATPMETVERFDERPNLVDFDTARDRDEETYSRERTEKGSGDDSETEDGTKRASKGRDDAEDETKRTTEDRKHSEEDQDRPGADESEWSSKASQDPEGDDPGEEATAKDGQSDDATEDGDASGSDASADRDFSKTSYNKVVKLLQNREFPVEEDEIITVAGSAYGIGRPETGRVLEALIDRGILERDGSQLRRADE